MFGYIKPFKPQMKFCEFDIYKSVYCGLCKKLSKSYGFFSRFLLNYDFVFLGILELSIRDCTISITPQTCIAHPFKKTPCLVCTDVLDYTSAAFVISVYHKLKDDLSDGNILKKAESLILIPFLFGGYKKAKEKYPHLCEVAEINMKRQTQLEKVKCKSIDLAAEPTANIMAEIASGITSNEALKSKLSRFGYLLGRYVYITDALDDYKKDFKFHSYNPLTLNEPDYEKAKILAQDSVFFTLGELGECYMNLNISKFKTITDNIVYLGLKNIFLHVKNERRTVKNERSL